MKQISTEHLKQLREEVDIAEVIRTLEIPIESSGRRVSFRCPGCTQCHTALSPQRNRAYCFRCARSFNTIDLVMAEKGCTFVEAVGFLEHILG